MTLQKHSQQQAEDFTRKRYMGDNEKVITSAVNRYNVIVFLEAKK